MTSKINNIYCIGRNYVQHAKELNNANGDHLTLKWGNEELGDLTIKF